MTGYAAINNARRQWLQELQSPRLRVRDYDVFQLGDPTDRMGYRPFLDRYGREPLIREHLTIRQRPFEPRPYAPLEEPGLLGRLFRAAEGFHPVP